MVLEILGCGGRFEDGLWDDNGVSCRLFFVASNVYSTGELCAQHSNLYVPAVIEHKVVGRTNSRAIHSERE